MEEILPFAKKIYDIDFEKVFKVPTIEAEETDAQRKRKRLRRLEAFEVLKVAVYSRVRSMEEEVSAEVEARFELHRARLGNINVKRLLRTGTSGPSGTASSQASTSSRPSQYKPQKTFLGSRKFPWWKSGDSTAAPDDLEKLSDYLYSRGLFSDIENHLCT